jgi:hypothetical protein
MLTYSYCNNTSKPTPSRNCIQLKNANNFSIEKVYSCSHKENNNPNTEWHIYL